MRLIDPNEIRFVLTPIAPVLSGGLVHYEQVAENLDKKDTSQAAIDALENTKEVAR